jgi:multiple sugar transport system ATP-binding protein
MGRAIVRDPKAFLMDEPLSNLDAKLRVQMRTQVARIQHQLGTTMLYVTHDQTEAMTLGDRVAVMRAGIIQQVDSPKVLYEDPANLFVAGFIGSPAMNFVPARIEGDTIKLPFGDAPMSAEIKQKLQGGGGGAREVIAGVRPEHFEDARLDDTAAGHRLKFRAKVDVVESMGSELYAYFEVADAETVKSDQLAEIAADAGMEDLPSSGSQIIARLDAASSARADQEIELSLDCSQIKLFEPEGGKSLLAPA